MTTQYRYLIAIVVIMAVLNFGVQGFALFQKQSQNTLPQGVSYHGETLGGLTIDQAAAKIDSINTTLLTQPINLTISDHAYSPTLKDLGYSLATPSDFSKFNPATWQEKLADYYALLAHATVNANSVELKTTVNETTLGQYLQKLQDGLPQKVENMSLTYANGTLTVNPATSGTNLSISAAESLINNQVKVGQSGAPIALPFTIASPEIKDASQITQAQQFTSQIVAQSLHITAANVSVTWTPDILFSFITYSINNGVLTASINAKALQAKVAELTAKVNIKATPKQVNQVDNSVITEGSDGRNLNATTTAQLITAHLKTGDLSPIALTPDVVAKTTIVKTPDYTLGRVAGKYIDINLTTQKMYLIEGNALDATYVVSTGKASTPTPPGDYVTQNHVRTAWSAPYGLYMDYWMAITPDGEYGIHQLPRSPSGWSEPIHDMGLRASHGCIRLSPTDAPTIFNWTPDGTNVYIHD